MGLTAGSDENGTLWLFVGTDPGYEGFTTQYIDSLDVTLTPTGNPAPIDQLRDELPDELPADE